MMANSHLTLTTGGSRSGKSSHALNLAEQLAGGQRRAFFVATAQPIDDEMRARIAHHRRLRPATFETIEEPMEVCEVIARLEKRAEVVVVDCLTLWVSNLLVAGRGHDAIMAEAGRLAPMLSAAPFASYVVTDEVGSGIVPMAPL